MTARVSDVLVVVVVCSLLLQNLHPSVITRSLKITRMVTYFSNENNSLQITCQSLIGMLISHYHSNICIFWKIFHGQTLAGNSASRFCFGGLSANKNLVVNSVIGGSFGFICDCMSVCLSHTGNARILINIGFCSLHHRTAQKF